MSDATATDNERFWFERKNDDFPYYRGNPISLGGAQWLLVMAGVAAGFFALINTLGMFRTGFAGFIPAILFVSLPLGALALVAGGAWKALFRPLRGIDFIWMFLFFLANVVLTLAVGTVIVSLFETSANPAGEMVAAATSLDKVLFFFKTGLQLFGEEVFTILPFLALLTWFVSRGMSRKLAIVLAAVLVAVLFAAVHLPTYQWNVPQAMIGLIPVRILLLIPYIMTKNIWVSTGVHVLNDWFIFGLPLLTAAAAE